MKTASIGLGIIITSILVGCAQTPRQLANIEMLASLPAPKTQEERDKTCTYLRSEIARLHNIAESAMNPAMYPFKTRVKARTTVTDFESKAAEFGCGFMMSRNKFTN